MRTQARLHCNSRRERICKLSIAGFFSGSIARQTEHPIKMSDTTTTISSCGCESTGLKRLPSWQGLTLASALPEIVPAAEAPEPVGPQGEYNPGGNVDEVPFS